MLTDPLKVRRNDPGRPEICPVFSLHNVVNAERVAKIEATCRSGELGCVDCKLELAARLNSVIGPVRERRANIDPASIPAILADGAERAREIAAPTLASVKSAMKIG